MFCWPWSAESCPGAEPARVTVHVRDKTGLNPLKDVTARLDASPGTPGAGSDPATIAAVTFNGTAAGDIFAPPPPGGTRDVVAQQQATMTLTFDKHLGVGEYTIPLRFTALNSGDDELQRLTVALKVRDPIVWAILVLLAAAAVSFLATRVVTMLRQRASFLGRVHAMRPAWLAQESPTLPVIWLRATLRQAEDLSRRFWLTGQRELDARLTAAEKMLTMLDRVRQVRGRINAISDQMVKQRATWKLDEVADELGAAPLTEQEIARLNAQLDRFDDWCSGPDKQMGVYWEDLYARIQAGLPQVKPFSDAAAQKLAAALLARLNAITGKPTRLGDMSDLDVAYRRLIILWEARNHADWLARIVALHLGDENAWKPIEEVYRVIDDGWWDILNDKQAVKCKVEGPPASTLDPPEAYETVVFGLVTEATDGNADPGSSYLMRKKLTYRWTITISTESSDAAGSIPPPAKTLTVVSTQPQMTQYSPIKGRLSASVAIAYGGRPGPSVDPSAPVGIAGSSDFSAWRMSEAADLIGFAAALMVSLFSGIKLYALGATFGSLTDYLALFTWGASLDQGKNFLQSLGAYSSGSPAAQGAAANAAAPTGQSPGEPPPAVTPPKPAEPKEAQSASPAPGPPPATGPRRDG
jgi:hypothetical protein